MTPEPLRRVLPGALLFACGVVGARGQVITQVDATTVHVRFDQPPVTSLTTDYPSVRFMPGDTVAISAGGCVQTGGAGKTWKRYVDPSGSNSDRLYHGTIRIPTATAGYERIQGLIARSPVVIGNPPESAADSQFDLGLGYEDDDFDDNGYYSHDDGTDGQCAGVGDAWVDLVIKHNSSPVLQPQLPRAPMDMWWNAVDDNLLPVNPLWGMQVDGNGNANGKVPDAGSLCNNFHDEGDKLQVGNPPCTTQSPTVDEPNGWDDRVFWGVCQVSGGVAGAVHGHINWGLATFTGRLYFTDHSVPVPSGFGDDDYDMTLERADQASSTTNDGTWDGGAKFALGLEFDSDETIDFFDTPWWKSFHSAVDADSSWTAARNMIDGANAIVLGLVGIDNKHGSHAELHPVLGLAAAVPSRATATSDMWVLFARPWGNEGGCSQDLHQFVSTKTMQFLLPYGASERPNVSSFEMRSIPSGGQFEATQLQDGLLLTITFPDAKAGSNAVAGALVWGEITVTHALLGTTATATARLFPPIQAIRPVRRGDSGSPSGSKTARSTLRSPVAASSLEEKQDEYLNPIAAQLTPAEWKKFTDAYARSPQAPPAGAGRFMVSTASFLKKQSGTNAAVSLFQSQSVRRVSSPVTPRHHVLAATDPRTVMVSARIPNRAQVLLHQQIATALRSAVGPTRADQILDRMGPPRSGTPKTIWALPAAPH